MDWKSLKSSVFSEFRSADGSAISYYSLPKLEGMGYKISRLPFSIRVVLESLLRNFDGTEVTLDDVELLSGWNPKDPSDRDVPFKVSRVLMQDFTGVPAIVDLAAMREYLTTMGEDAQKIKPVIPVDLVIDHSVQVDSFNLPSSLQINQEKEMQRNRERYALLKWADSAFQGFRVFPPSAGICHQVNLEYLATCVTVSDINGKKIAFPDTLVGTDSHTTMVDSLGIVGFGVGGIEAEAALLGQSVALTTPKVLGVKLIGSLRDGITATDFALTLTKILRNKGVVNMFVEFFGEGLESLSLPDRATLSNMCPEYGATIAIFPPDEETFRYMEMTGRKKEAIEVARRYYLEQGMLNIDYSKVEYSDTITVDLSSIVPCVSGPSQPKQEIPLPSVRSNFMDTFLKNDSSAQVLDELTRNDYNRLASESAAAGPNNVKISHHKDIKKAHLRYDDGYETDLSDGDVVISSITSCTNTSNPEVMIGAGILAKKALEKGLKVDTRKVKTSLGPGSRVVMRYLERAGLVEPLARLGYGLVGYGCITCIGNSGPLIDKQSDAINGNDLVVASVLSGNRNYEARIHRDVRANYLMSPPMLIAFAIAGSVLKDLSSEPLGRDLSGNDVYLKDIWPTNAEVSEAIKKSVSIDLFESEYGHGIENVNPYWSRLSSPTGSRYAWDMESTYIRLPPFFDHFNPSEKRKIMPIKEARVLAAFGDSISTDHISPAGAIGKDSPAGKYLLQHNVAQADFNTYGTRRGNHEVMMRGTFANNRIKNRIMNGKEGGYTLHYPDMKEMTIYDAAMLYKGESVPLVVIAGSEYGSGSSRDWAAKGPMLLGVKAVVAKGYERIHRSNLIGMGVIPLQFAQGEDADTLKIDFSKTIDIEIKEGMSPRDKVRMSYTRADGKPGEAILISRIDTTLELDYYESGGILNHVIKKIIGK